MNQPTKVKCIDIKYNKQGCIESCLLINQQNNRKEFKASELKRAISNKQIEVVNLTLTSDNRLIYSQEQQSKEPQVNEEQISEIKNKLEDFYEEKENYKNKSEDITKTQVAYYITSKQKEQFKFVDELSQLTNNLYNDALFILRQCYFNMDPIASILGIKRRNTLPIDRKNVNNFYQQYIKVAEAKPEINGQKSFNFLEDYNKVHKINAHLATITVAQAAEDMLNFQSAFEKYTNIESDKQLKNLNYKTPTKKIKCQDGSTIEISKGSPRVPKYRKTKYNKLERQSIILDSLKQTISYLDLHNKAKRIEKRNPDNKELSSMKNDLVLASNKYSKDKLFKCKLLRASTGFNIAPIIITEDFKNKQIQQLRIRPINSNKYAVEFIYRDPIQKPKFKPNKFTQLTGTNITGLASIDIGVDNFVTMTFIADHPMNPVIINGKGLKHYISTVNTEIENYRSKIDINEKNKEQKERNYNTKRIQQIQQAYQNTTNDFYHKASRKIINILKENNINYLVLGYNKRWKDKSKLNKRTNRVFNKIAFYKFTNILRYKCKLEGIEFHTNNEKFTSGTSFLDQEAPDESCYNISRRVATKYFFTNNGIQLLADVNASLQIAVKHQKQCKAYKSSNLDKFLEIKYSNPILKHCFKLELLTQPIVIDLDTFKSKSDRNYLIYHQKKNLRKHKTKTIQLIDIYRNQSNTNNKLKIKQYFQSDQEKLAQKKLNRHNQNLRKIKIKQLDSQQKSNMLRFRAIGY